jgi:aspartyl protease
MPMRSFGLVIPLALLACGATAMGGTAAAEPPRLHKPAPAPPSANPVIPIPRALFDEKLDISGDAVKAKLITTRLSVEANVNGRGPYRFVVDSGADTSAIGLRVARDLQLPLGTPVVMNDMTARDVVDRVKVDELSFGPSSVRELELPALKEGDIGGDGMLGIDALVHQRLLLDFEKHLIKVEDARGPAFSMPGAIVITARRQRGQLILTRVSAGGVPLDAVVDTGSEITVGNLALRDRLLKKGRTDFSTVTVIGVTGVSVDLQVAHVPELRLGPVVLRDVPIAFADLPPFKIFGLADEPGLLLGSDILEKFRRVSLDFRARKVRFQLRTCKTDDVVVNLTPVAWATHISWYGDPSDCTA